MPHPFPFDVARLVLGLHVRCGIGRSGCRLVHSIPSPSRASIGQPAHAPVHFPAERPAAATSIDDTRGKRLEKSGGNAGEQLPTAPSCARPGDRQSITRPGHRHVGQPALFFGAGFAFGGAAQREQPEFFHSGQDYNRPFKAFRRVDRHQGNPACVTHPALTRGSERGGFQKPLQRGGRTFGVGFFRPLGSGGQ